jgi:hypothetical protein
MWNKTFDALGYYVLEIIPYLLHATTIAAHNPNLSRRRICRPKTSVLCLFLNINQLDALNFIISLFQASTCFEHMCSSSGEKNCIIQHLVSSHSVGDRPVHGLREDCARDGHLQV